MATSKNRSLKKAQIPSVCHLCEDSKTIQWKCLDCDLLLCDVCKVNVHSKFKSADTHDVISLKDIGKEQKKNHSASNITCKAHPGYQVCLYCITCDAVACPKCVSESHTKHHLESIDKIHDDIVVRLNYIKDELTADLNVSFENEKKIEKKNAADKSMYKTRKTAIHRHLEEIKRVVDEEGEKLLTRLEKNWTDIDTVNQSNKSAILRLRKDILTKISTVKVTLDECDTVANIECERKMASGWCHRQKLIENAFDLKWMEFISGSVDKQGLQSMIGNIERFKQPEIQFELLRSQKTAMGNITQMYACRDGHVFVCDEKYSHTLMNMVFKGSEFKDINKFSDLRVFDIVEGDKDNFILSFIGETFLKIMKSNGKIEDYLDMSPWKPRALHRSNAGHLLIGGLEQGDIFPVTDKSERKIIVLDKDGRKIHEYQFDAHKTRLFSYVLRIKTLANNDMVIIDTYGQDFEGNVISIRYPNTTNWIYSGESGRKSANPFTPISIATTDIGNIIVNDGDNHLLHILDIKGSLVTLIKTDDYGILLPHSLSLDSANRLWIGCWDKENKRNAMLHIVKFSGF